VDIDELEKQLRAAGVKYLMPSFVDMHGIPKAKIVPIDHLHSCSRGSELFTGAAVDGVPQAVSDDEVCAVADPATMAVPLPYRRDVCYVPASLYYQGTPFEACSRNIYSRVAALAKERGYLFKLGIEAEFFVLRDAADAASMRALRPFSDLEDLEKPCYDAARLVDNLPWLSELVEAMDELGWGALP
jgi:glutamine synthetase